MEIFTGSYTSLTALACELTPALKTSKRGAARANVLRAYEIKRAELEAFLYSKNYPNGMVVTFVNRPISK